MDMDRTLLRNVNGWNITKVRAVQTKKQFTVQVCTKPVYCTSVQTNSLKTMNEVEFQLEHRQTDRQHTLGLVQLLLRS